MLFPTPMTCHNSKCLRPDGLLRWKEDPKRVVLFMMAEGVQEGYAVQLYCSGEYFMNMFVLLPVQAVSLECRTVYYPNYSAHNDVQVRHYYEGIPEYIQVSNHHYVQRSVLEHFTMLSVLSWTSATNTAHIYHESLSHLDNDNCNIPRFRLRTEHAWDGFIVLALLRDAQSRNAVLEVPHNGIQANRYTTAMQLRNERIRRSGQPQYAHFCTRCHRRFDHPVRDPSMCPCMVLQYVCLLVFDSIC